MYYDSNMYINDVNIVLAGPQVCFHMNSQHVSKICGMGYEYFSLRRQGMVSDIHRLRQYVSWLCNWFYKFGSRKGYGDNVCIVNWFYKFRSRKGCGDSVVKLNINSIVSNKTSKIIQSNKHRLNHPVITMWITFDWVQSVFFSRRWPLVLIFVTIWNYLLEE